MKGNIETPILQEKVSKKQHRKQKIEKITYKNKQLAKKKTSIYIFIKHTIFFYVCTPIHE